MCWLEAMRLMAAVSGEMRQKEELLEVDRFGFEKTQSENLKKGADPRLKPDSL
jgi:hypothetical protein